MSEQKRKDARSADMPDLTQSHSDLWPRTDRQLMQLIDLTQQEKYILSHCHTVMTYWDTWIEQSRCKCQQHL